MQDPHKAAETQDPHQEFGAPAQTFPQIRETIQLNIDENGRLVEEHIKFGKQEGGGDRHRGGDRKDICVSK